MNTNFLIAYIAIINIVAFCLFGIDKSAAVKEKWRIPNRVLLGLAAFWWVNRCLGRNVHVQA